MRIKELPDSASPKERFLRMARAAVNTTPAEIREREQAEAAERLEAGKKKRGPAKGTVPAHKQAIP